MYCTIMYMVPVSFDWNEGNRDKNWVKHMMSTKECEEAFFNKPHIIAPDPDHSKNERRYSLLGTTNSRRLVRIIYTIRNDSIRVISARDQSKKERSIYEKTKKA